MIRIGVIGTSAWTGRMYLTALKDHPHGHITAVCGRDPARTAAFAQDGSVTTHYTDWQQMLDSGTLDAVIISTPNVMHHPMAIHALNNGLHVLCEKPLAMTYAEADDIATTAEQRGLVGMTAFTFWHFPQFHYIARLVQDGTIGQPRHLNLRYYSDYFAQPDVRWRFDRREAGSGALGDLGSHALSIARLILGEVREVSAYLETHIHREAIPAEYRVDDHAIVMLQFENDASATLDISGVAQQAKTGGQKQALELIGETGTITFSNDFVTQFSLTLARPGDEAPSPVHIPEPYWPPNVRRDNPRAMFTDLFTQTDTMARAWVTAIATGQPMIGPTLRDGAIVQKLQDTAIRSAVEGSVWLPVR